MEFLRNLDGLVHWRKVTGERANMLRLQSQIWPEMKTVHLVMKYWNSKKQRLKRKRTEWVFGLPITSDSQRVLLDRSRTGKGLQ